MRSTAKIFPYFLWGLGSQMQIVASLSFTELFIVVATPFLIGREMYYLRRNGILPFFWLSICLVIGCAVACLVNHTPFSFALRGIAVCGLMPCGIVVGHWMLRRNMNGFKWIIVGGVVSLFLCTFIFQKSVDMAVADRGAYGATAEGLMSSATYWKHRVSAILRLPANGWYLQCPLWYSQFAPLLLAVLAMTITVSGRGTAVQAVATAVLVFIGGKKRKTMRRLGQYFYLLVAVGFIGAFVLKEVYQYAALNDWLGEAQRKKYEVQTKGNTSLMGLLMGGRMASFCGLIACVDKPIVGFGPWAFDYGGYTGEFLSKYGTPEDYENHLKAQMNNKEGTVGLIPCHSVITELWLWYGIFGLLFCIYIFFVVCRYLRQDCWAVPQWYFWLAASAPGLFWDLCFNPLQSRIGLTFFPLACLLARAVRRGVHPLPMEMLREIQKAERN